MSKKVKKVNPYEKKQKRTLKISRKQWIAIISALSVIAIIVGIVVMVKLQQNSSLADPHAGHDHSTTGEEHYEGDGHGHGTASTAANANTAEKVKYQIYTNEDQTYRLVFRDNAGKTVAEFDKIVKKPSPATIDAEKGIYELGWATDSGVNDFECVYYNAKTGQVSEQLHAPRGTDGVRVAYGSEDQKTVIVQDLFNKGAYCKEYELKNAEEKNGNIILSGVLDAKNKAVKITYNSSDSKSGHATIPLYE